MKYGRQEAVTWERVLKQPYVHIIFGARQTGKSTLLKALLPKAALALDLARPASRVRYLNDPDLLVRECEAMPRSRMPHVVVIDEAQNVPALFDAVQYLYDSDKRRWRFVLCGSSARRLRISGANLLPGRSMIHHLYPLTLAERPAPNAMLSSPPPKHWPFAVRGRPKPVMRPFPAAGIEERMLYGELPGIATAPKAQRGHLLRTYSLVYLEEELRREALVKDWPAFARFLRLAALESGTMINYTSIANEARVSLPTVKTYYQLLEDLFMGFTVNAFSGSPRKSVLSTGRFFFFDPGVRNAASELPLSLDMVRTAPGPLFEQWVTIELWKRLRYRGSGALHYLRTKAGMEVDLIVDLDGRLTPIEVKWTERPSPQDARHLNAFLDDHPGKAVHGFIVCRCTRPQAVNERVTAIPWWML
jgi:predicted AAA+ superfamily ATPase